jgi:hypothetical protein
LYSKNYLKFKHLLVNKYLLGVSGLKFCHVSKKSIFFQNYFFVDILRNYKVDILTLPIKSLLWSPRWVAVAAGLSSAWFAWPQRPFA